MTNVPASFSQQIVLQTQVVLDGDEFLGFLVQGNNDIATTDQVGNVLGVRQLRSSAAPVVGETRTVSEWVDRRVSLAPDVCKLFQCNFSAIRMCCKAQYRVFLI
jgi:hypothetical protein